MSYNSQELKALAAPFWGVDMDDLDGVVVVGFTTDRRVLFIDSSQGSHEPGGAAARTPGASRDQAAATAVHLVHAAEQIILGCVLGHE